MNNNKQIHHSSIMYVESEEEAEQFRYEHDDSTVDIGTSVGYEIHKRNNTTRLPWQDDTDIALDFILFDGIYYTGCTTD